MRRQACKGTMKIISQLRTGYAAFNHGDFEGRRRRTCSQDRMDATDKCFPKRHYTAW